LVLDPACDRSEQLAFLAGGGDEGRKGSADGEPASQSEERGLLQAAGGFAPGAVISLDGPLAGGLALAVNLAIVSGCLPGYHYASSDFFLPRFGAFFDVMASVSLPNNSFTGSPGVDK